MNHYKLTADQADVAAAALLPRLSALRSLLENPILQLPDGIVDWEKAKQQYKLIEETWCVLLNISNVPEAQ